jgi:hypothetical protein
METPKRRFTFQVEGKYYGSHDQTGLPVIKTYIGKFVLPSQEAALSVIVRFLLKPYLTKNYPDFASIRTHRITSMDTEGRLPDPKVNQMAFEDMEIADLSDFCILNQIFIDPYKHKNFEQCREQVMKMYQSRSDEKKMLKKTGKDVELKEVDELLKLNNLEPLEEEFSMGAQRIGAALKNRGDGRVTESVGAQHMPTPRSPLENTPPLADAPGMVEEPVDNDPELTAKAFEEGAKKNKAAVEDLFS